jgi:D-alanine-D-alanine ligase
MAKKLSIGVVFGGCSCEADVSVASATSVLHHLDTNKFEIIPIGITKTGSWMVIPSSLPLKDIDHYTTNCIGSEPTIDFFSPLVTQTPPPLALSQIEQKIDVFFPLLHGTNGEDGTFQSLLEMIDVPYVGCGVLAGALGMDKEKMKQVLQTTDIALVDYKSYRRSHWERDPEDIMDEIEKELQYPCFVKPANGGSSIGVSKVRSRLQLRSAIDLAASYDRKIIIERGLNCRELECAVLGNEEPEASVVGEVLLHKGCDFYDYDAKYIQPCLKAIPADIPLSLALQVQEQSIQAFRTLDMTGLARFDFFLENETNKLYLNEINTLPSFTEDCMYPKLCEASGIAYPELLERLIELAIESHEERQRSSAARK